jgi:hypothetical protein
VLKTLTCGCGLRRDIAIGRLENYLPRTLAIALSALICAIAMCHKEAPDRQLIGCFFVLG